VHYRPHPHREKTARWEGINLACLYSWRIASLCFVRISSPGGHDQAPGECLEGPFCKCFY